MFDPMADLAGESSTPAFTDKPSQNRSRPPRDSNRAYAEDIHSVSIRTEQRTFYFDLKKSDNGKFVKLSEKSRNGRKSTIMLDGSDIDEFIAAFTELKTHI